MTADKDQITWFIQWTYAPADFFEEPLEIVHEHCELSVEAGKIVAKINHKCGDPRPELCDQLHAELNNRFIGAQLVCGKPFTLSLVAVYNEKPTGERSTFVTVEDLVITASLCADVRITGKNGVVVWDARKERMDQMRSLGDLAGKYGPNDAVAGKILQSYKNAIQDYDNLLVHLYEIRDALAKRFSREEKAKRELNIKGEWGYLGKLANSEPLRQGRHRGRMLKGLRDATAGELDAALAAARKMIENYLRYLDGCL